MFIYQVLKRRDAASLIVAIVIALAIGELFSAVGSSLSIRIIGTGEDYGIGSSWRYMYVQPILTFVIKLIALELLIRLFVYYTARTRKK